MDLIERVEELQVLVEEAKAVPLSSSAVINREEFLELLAQLKQEVPDEIRQARWMSRDRDELLGRARKEAERIIADARRTARTDCCLGPRSSMPQNARPSESQTMPRSARPNCAWKQRTTSIRNWRDSRFFSTRPSPRSSAAGPSSRARSTLRFRCRPSTRISRPSRVPSTPHNSTRNPPSSLRRSFAAPRRAKGSESARAGSKSLVPSETAELGPLPGVLPG